MATTKKANVAKLATGRKKPPTKKVTTARKEPEKKDVETLAKERVEKLLEDVELTPPIASEELLELDDSQPKSLEWLEEQVGKLSEENEKLRGVASEAKEEYGKLFNSYQALKNGEEPVAGVIQEGLIPDSQLKLSITALFEEAQNQYIGNNQEKRRYTQMQLIHLLHKMVKSFSFLETLRRF